VRAVEGADICVLLLPEPLEASSVRDQADDLLRADGVVAVDPPRMPYSAFGRVPLGLGDGLAARQARRLVRTLRRKLGEPRVVVIFHPLQYQLGRAVIAQSPGAELWYWRSQRVERAPGLSDRARDRLETLHEQAAERAALVICASDELARIEGVAGRRPVLVPPAADGFPAPPVPEVVAVCLDRLGGDTDWALLRAVAQQLRNRLVVLLAGETAEDECRGDEDYAWCRESPNLVWLGPVPEAVAARLVACADVGLAPLRADSSSDSAAPKSILQCARLGRRTVTPEVAGVRMWARAAVAANGPEAIAEALLRFAGARARPDEELREWALEQTARVQDDPLWQRLADAGIDVRVSR
jgi:hypothetical protein